MSSVWLTEAHLKSYQNDQMRTHHNISFKPEHFVHNITFVERAEKINLVNSEFQNTRLLPNVSGKQKDFLTITKRKNAEKFIETLKDSLFVYLNWKPYVFIKAIQKIFSFCYALDGFLLCSWWWWLLFYLKGTYFLKGDSRILQFSDTVLGYLQIRKFWIVREFRF